MPPNGVCGFSRIFKSSHSHCSGSSKRNWTFRTCLIYSTTLFFSYQKHISRFQWYDQHSRLTATIQKDRHNTVALPAIIVTLPYSVIATAHERYNRTLKKGTWNTGKFFQIGKIHTKLIKPILASSREGWQCSRNPC
jgi:membrane-bound acyltransferase YfiQ involved in biofilm formation